MTTLEFIKWAMDEHPILFLLSVWLLSYSIASLGRIGSTSVRVKEHTKETDK